MFNQYHVFHPLKKLSSMIVVVCSMYQIGCSQNSHVYNHDDTLRGAITQQRAWWDVTHYTLKVKPNIENKTISGVNIIRFKTLKSDSILQIDLQPNLKIDSAVYFSQKCKVLDEGVNAHLVYLPSASKLNSISEISIYYSGKPIIAVNPPWEGGFQWETNDGLPYISTSCQGLGASSWWPCKDHPSDEPDSMQIEITAPKNLVAVSNGRLNRIIEEPTGERTFVWVVKNPINNYGVNLNIANYYHYSDEYAGEKGKLDIDYYVLPKNIERAKKQFTQVKDMLKAFEYWFGPYPFYEDSYKIVEVPYLGMEHQSDVSYGNGYGNGYRGRDLSGTGFGLKWDFIIVHESGHEWFGNNITHSDIAEMYIHEGFTAYSESLFTEFFYGKEAGAAYVIGTRNQIENQIPLVGDYNVNKESSVDIYYKGSNMLHTLRQIINNDELWRKILRGLNSEFYHKVVTTKQVEDYIAKMAGLNLKPFFNQYLRDAREPNFEYKLEGKTLSYRFTNCMPGFSMPLNIKINTDSVWKRINPTSKWQKLKLKSKSENIIVADINYYVTLNSVK